MRTLVAAFVTLMLTGCGGSDTDAADPVFRDDDQRVLDQLEQAGADLEQPRPVDFYLYFDSKEAASAAAKALAGDGQTAVTPPGEGVDIWSVSLEKRFVVNRESLGELQGRLVSIAEEHGGDYDGWEAPVEP